MKRVIEILINKLISKDKQERDKSLLEDFKNDPLFKQAEPVFEDGVRNDANVLCPSFFTLPDNYPREIFDILARFEMSSTWFTQKSSFHDKKLEQRRKKFKLNLQAVREGVLFHEEPMGHLKIMPILDRWHRDQGEEEVRKCLAERERNCEKFYTILDNTLASYEDFFEAEGRVCDELNYIRWKIVLTLIAVLCIFYLLPAPQILQWVMSQIPV